MRARAEPKAHRTLHAEHAALLASIRDEKKLTDDSEGKLKAALEKFTEHFA